VQETHPFFRKEALSLEIERQEQNKFLGDQDWIVRARPFYAHVENTAISSLIPDKIDSVGIGAAVERTFWKTGGLLSLAYDYTRSDQDIDDLVIPGIATIPVESGVFHENGLSATYSHPLLQNKGGALSRLGYELQGYSVRAVQVNIQETQELFLLEVGDSFIDGVLLIEQRRILYKRLELAKEELERTTRKRKQNLVDEVDVLRARDSVLNVEQNVLGIEARWKAKQAELSTIAQFDLSKGLMPEYDIYELVTLPSVDDAIDMLKQNSRVLNVLQIRMNQLEHEKKGVMEQGKPRLDLDISGGLKSGDDNFSDSYSYDKPQFAAALRFSYPLGNRTTRAEILKTSLEKNRVQEDMNNIKLGLEASLRNLMTQLKELEKVLILNRKQMLVAKDKTKAEQKRYNQGRIELTFVIQSRDNEQNVQLIYAQNGALYHKLLLRYHELMDTLMDSRI
jgi:outer membrane protein TolC